MQQALADRLLLSEAIDAVGCMIRGYGNTAQAGKAYIGAIADLLMQYPRSVALACADPRTGVAITTKFLPTPGDIVPWCEKASRPLREEAARELRTQDQLVARAEWEAAARPVDTSQQITYGEFLRMADAGEVKPRPIGRFEQVPE